MGRFLLCGREAALPYQVEEMDLRLYSVEELCCFIYDNLSLIDDGFVDRRLLGFIREELGLDELYEKLMQIPLPDEQDAALFLILQATGYHTEEELNQFQERLQWRKRKSAQEKLKEKADILFDRRRYNTAVRAYKALLTEGPEGCMTEGFYESAKESLANAYGHLSQFGNAERILSELYTETGSERILKKLYDVCMLSGDPFPRERYKKYEDRFDAWQKEYQEKAESLMENIEDAPVLAAFGKGEADTKAALREYAEAKKEEYRSMLE